MDAIASLGMRFDSGGVTQTWQQLDRLTASSAAAQRQMEALTRASVASTAAAQARVAADTANYRQVLLDIDAERRLETARLAAQISDKGRADSLNRLAQLARDSVAAGQALATLERDLTVATDAHTNALQKNISAMAQIRSTQQASASAGAAAYQTGINSSLGIQTSFSTAGRAEDVAAYGVALDALRAKYNPVFAASKAYEQEIEAISLAHRQGAVSTLEYEAALETARLAFEAESVAATGAANAHGSLSTQSMAAFHSLRSMAEGAAMGVPPTQILAMQIGQLSYAASGPGGLVGAFKGAAGAFVGLLNPAVLAGAAIVGLSAAAAAAFSSYIDSEKRLQVATQGLGAAAGATVSDLQSIAIQAAASGKVTIAQAEEMEAAYAKTGMIGKQNLLGLISVTKDFAAQTGLSVDDATARLAKMASDPMKGIDDLALSIGGVTGQTRELIQAQLAQGNQQRAVTIFTEAARKSLTDYRANQTALSREGAAIWSGMVNGWHDTGKAISDAYDKLVKFNQQHPWVLQGGLLQQFLQPPPSPAAPNKNAAGINQVYAQLGHADQETGYDQLFALQRQAGLDQAALAKAQGIAGAASSTEIDRLTDALARERGAIASMTNVNGQLITSEDVRLQQDQLTIRGLTQRTPIEQAAIARQQTYLSLVGAHISAAKAAVLAESAGAVAFATAQKALDDQNKTIDLNIEATTALARAYMSGDMAAAIDAQAKYQALQEKVSNPAIDVEIRKRQILAQTIGGQVDSLAAQMDQQQRLNAITQAANYNVASGVLAYDRLNDYIQQQVQLQQLQTQRTAAVNAGDIQHIALIDQQIDRLPRLTKELQANADASARIAALNPNAGDVRLTQGLQAGVANGEIKGDKNMSAQEKANAAVGQISLFQSTGSALNDVAQGNPFGQGAQTALGFNIKGIEAQAAQYKKIMGDAADAGLIGPQQAADERVAIEEGANRKIAQAYADSNAQRLTMASTFFGQFASLSQSKNKEISAVGKSAAIIQAEIDGVLAVQKALAAYPPPWNFAMAAAVGAATAANVAQIAGFADGVVGVQGPGSGTSDSILARLSNGESVVTASATRKNANTLAAMNDGASFDAIRGGGMNVHVTVENHTSAGVQVKQIGPNQVRVIVDQRIAQHTPGIVAAAVQRSADLSPDWVAKANRNPRRRSNG